MSEQQEQIQVSAESALRIIRESSEELVSILREKWGKPDQDAITLFMAAFVAGMASEWEKVNPPNGFVHSCSFPGIGRLEMEIRRVDGDSAAETITRLQAELAEARKEIEALRAERGPQEDATATVEKVLNYLADQAYAGEEILHPVIACDFVSRQRMVRALVRVLRSNDAAMQQEAASE